MTKQNQRYLMFSYLAGLLLLTLDLVVKYIANSYLVFHQRVESGIKGLNFFLTHNTGYHYIFGEIENHQLWATFGLIMLVFLLFSLTRSLIKEKALFYKKLYAIILMLTVGAGGNVVEILVTKKATDFFILAPFPWPSNICDQYINGIIYIVIPVMLVKSLIDKRSHSNKPIKADEKN